MGDGKRGGPDQEVAGQVFVDPDTLQQGHLDRMRRPAGPPASAGVALAALPATPKPIVIRRFPPTCMTR